MPDGSYFSHGTPGISGNSMKLTAIDNATNNAYTAMRRVDQRPESATPVACVEADDADGTDVEWVSVCEDTLMRAPRFFHPDCNRWLRNRTGSAAFAGRGLRRPPL